MESKKFHRLIKKKHCGKSSLEHARATKGFRRGFVNSFEDDTEGCKFRILVAALFFGFLFYKKDSLSSYYHSLHIICRVRGEELGVRS